MNNLLGYQINAFFYFTNVLDNLFVYRCIYFGRSAKLREISGIKPQHTNFAGDPETLLFHVLL